MRYLIPFALLLALAGCTNWDWKQTVRSALESGCNSVGNCGVPCDSNPTEGWCQ